MEKLAYCLDVRRVAEGHVANSFASQNSGVAGEYEGGHAMKDVSFVMPN